MARALLAEVSCDPACEEDPAALMVSASPSSVTPFVKSGDELCGQDAECAAACMNSGNAGAGPLWRCARMCD